MNYKFFHWYAYATLALAWIGMIVVGCLLIYPYKVADIQSPAEVCTKQVKVGEPLCYRFVAEVYNKYEVIEIRRILSNDVDYILHKTNPPTPEVGSIDVIVSSNIVPDVPPGTYILYFSALHRVNPIRNIELNWETEPFEIIK